jgi:cytochrome c oxidase assembly factor CtaG
MSPTFDAFLRSWPFDPWLFGALVVTAIIYLRGYFILRHRSQRRWQRGQATAFLAGLGAIYLALASPIEPFAGLLLSVHMAQHLLLMMVAPPLLLLGAPLFPLLRGLPGPVRKHWIAPLVRSPALTGFFSRLTHPFVALPLYTVVTWGWHAPAVYDLALRAPAWHYAQHASFLGAALAFWYPVVRPYPARPRWSPWLLAPMLILADVQNTVLSAVLTFSDRVIYPYYAEVPRVAGVSALDDQAAAGVLMWVPGSVAFLVPLFMIGIRLLGVRSAECGVRNENAARAIAIGDMVNRARIPLPVIADSSKPSTPQSTIRDPQLVDLLRLPVLGQFLRWRYARVSLQVPLLVLAAALIYDGLCGPDVSAMNLAGVLPWVHWRGLIVLGLLAVGNVFCFACPFLLPRTLGRWAARAIGAPVARLAWPRRLRSKWLAVVLLVLFLWAYEAFALWDSPWWTAWIALGYFAAAFIVDGLFRGASFCKYVCPIGQFNFVQALVAPTEVKVRDPAICAGCRTKDCLRGRDGIPGCELNLYLPRKVGNMDCTGCLDCVHACPAENVGLLARAPAAELWHEGQRSGVGRFSARPDLAALALVLVFGAFANAAGMVGPVVAWLETLGPRLLTTSIFYSISLLVLPALTVATAALLSRWWGRLEGSSVRVATRFAYALVPLGFSMWLAHYSFHFLSGYDAALPAVQRFAADLGWAGLGGANGACGCCRPVADWLLRLEIVFLDVGLLLSLYTGYRIALAQTPSLALAFKALLPWALLIVLLFAVGIWILFQPMDMRGTMLP